MIPSKLHLLQFNLNLIIKQIILITNHPTFHLRFYLEFILPQAALRVHRSIDATSIIDTSIVESRMNRDRSPFTMHGSVIKTRRSQSSIESHAPCRKIAHLSSLILLSLYPRISRKGLPSPRSFTVSLLPFPRAFLSRPPLLRPY